MGASTRRGILIGLLATGAMVCRAEPAPGNGIHFGRGAISPYADLSATYDSNVANEQGEADDFFQEDAGIISGYTSGPIDLGLDGFFTAREYAKESGGNFESGGERFKAKYEREDTLSVEARQSYRRVEDIDQQRDSIGVLGVSPESVLDASARDRRDINQAGVGAKEVLTDKLDVRAGYEFDAVNYVNSGLLDVTDQNGLLESGFQITEKSAALLSGIYGEQDVNESSESMKYVKGRVGLETRGTDKLSFKGGVGVQNYDRSFGGNKSSFNYDLLAIWTATDKVGFQAGARNGAQLSSVYADNGTEYSSVWLAGRYRIVPTISLSLTGSYRRDDYIDPVDNNGVLVDRTDDGYGVQGRVEYQTPAKFLMAYAETGYQQVNSNIHDYDETRVTAGVRVQY